MLRANMYVPMGSAAQGGGTYQRVTKEKKVQGKFTVVQVDSPSEDRRPR